MYAIDEKLLVQWYVAGLLQNIIAPLWMYNLSTCEEIIIKAQKIEMDDEGLVNTSSVERRLEDKTMELQQTIKNI
jgi:hypothetical protein